MWGGCQTDNAMPDDNELVEPTIQKQPLVMDPEMSSAIKSLLAQANGLQEDMARMRQEKEKKERAAKEGEAASVEAGQAGGPTRVMVQATVRRIFNVDTVEQTFGIQILLRLLWKAPPEEEIPDHAYVFGWKPNWVPKYRFRRIMEEKGFMEMYHVKKTRAGHFIQADLDHLLVIYEQLELHDFPIDVQDLTTEVLSLHPASEVVWVPFAPNIELTLPKSQNVKGLDAVEATKGPPPMVTLLKAQVAMNDFSLVKEISHTYHLTQLQLEYPVSDLKVSVKTSRKAGYYMLNVAFIMMAIITFVFSAWASHPGDIGNRLGTDFNLVLTAVAFKLELQDRLPLVSYATILDVYVNIGCVFLAAVTVCHSVLPYWLVEAIENSPLTFPPDFNEHEEDLIKRDTQALQAFGVIWTAFNVIFYAYFYFRGKHVYRRFMKDALHEQAKFDAEHETARSESVGLFE